MDLNLKGKRALITGSTAGIGEAAARYLASEGAVVVVHGRDLARAQSVADSIVSTGARAYAIAAAITDDEQVALGATRIGELIGGVDILVNNAGAYPMAGWFDSRPSDWLEAYDLDVVGGIRMIQALAPGMRDRGWGRIIQVSSSSAVRAPSNFFPIYATAKSAQSFLAKSLAAELAGTGITVNVVSPGVVSTETNRRLLTAQAEREGRPTDWPSIERHYIATMMINPIVPRMATPEQVAPLIAYLCSPIADHVTGAEYLMDGGYAISGFRRQPTDFDDGAGK